MSLAKRLPSLPSMWPCRCVGLARDPVWPAFRRDQFTSRRNASSPPSFGLGLKITPTLWLRKLCPIATQPTDHSIINLQSSLLFIRMLFDYVFYGGWMPNL